MNNKGFTLVELITTFSLTAVLLVLLLNVVLIIKDIYVKYEIKTEMLIKQGNLNTYVNDIIINGELSSYTRNDNTFTFTMNNGETHTLSIENNKIIFDNYTYKLNNDATIGDVEAPDVWVSGILQIKIPIKHKLYSDYDFGLNLVYID